MEIVSLILIVVLFMLGFVAYRLVVVSPRQKQEELTRKLHSWVVSFDKLDSLRDRDERSLCLHELLVERRILLEELNQNANLKGLMHKLDCVEA